MNPWINIIAGSRSGAGTQDQQCGAPNRALVRVQETLLLKALEFEALINWNYFTLASRQQKSLGILKSILNFIWISFGGVPPPPDLALPMSKYIC